MKTIAICTLLLLTVTHAPAGNGGSAYTMFGLGDLRYYPSPRSAGMGFTGFALPSGSSINTMMPAAWTRITRVRVEANGLYEGINSAETDKALYQARGLFNGATFAFPVIPASGVVLVGGLSPYSHVAYNNSFTNSQGGISYRLNEIGSGGLTRAQLGLSYAPHPDISLGASLNYLFGKFTVQRTLNPLTEGMSGGTLYDDKESRGVNITLGGMFTGFGTWVEGLRPLSVGFALTTQSYLKHDLSKRVLFQTEADTFGSSEAQLKIPVAIGVGIGYQLADRWIFAADYYTQAWNNATYAGQPLLNIRGNSRFGIGAEKLPLKDTDKWLDKLTYRLGFSYNQTYYTIFGEPINEWAATAGFTMPVAGETRMTIGVEYAQRGTKAQVTLPNASLTNLVRDNIIRVSLSLSIGELWFVRYEEE